MRWYNWYHCGVENLRFNTNERAVFWLNFNCLCLLFACSFVCLQIFHFALFSFLFCFVLFSFCCVSWLDDVVVVHHPTIKVFQVACVHIFQPIQHQKNSIHENVEKCAHLFGKPVSVISVFFSFSFVSLLTLSHLNNIYRYGSVPSYLRLQITFVHPHILCGNFHAPKQNVSFWMRFHTYSAMGQSALRIERFILIL